MGDKRDSYVLFQMPSNLTGWQYKEMIMRLLIDFFLWVDPNIKPEWAKRLGMSDWNRESGIASLKVRGQYIGHLKMYLFDDKLPHTYSELSKHILFRDHYSQLDVERVYLVANAFEEFLQERGVKYIRHNRNRN